MKNWKLFIDDERSPVSNDWVIARSSTNAIMAVCSWGMPVEIAFDHDLGGDDTSIKFIHWLMEKVLDGDLTIPEGFTYSVHSQNPIGAANIKSKMDALIGWYVTFPGGQQKCSVEGCTNKALDQGKGPSVCKEHDPGR